MMVRKFPRFNQHTATIIDPVPLASLAELAAVKDHYVKEIVSGWCLDLQFSFLERAAIMEFEGKLDRPAAELAACEDILNKLNLIADESVVSSFR